MNYRFILNIRDLHLRVWELNEELLEKVDEYDNLEELDRDLMFKDEEPLYVIIAFKLLLVFNTKVLSSNFL